MSELTLLLYRMAKLEDQNATFLKKLDMSLKSQESKDAEIAALKQVAELSSTLASMQTPQKAAFSSSPAKRAGEPAGTPGRSLSAAAADQEAQMEALQEELESIKDKLEEEKFAHEQTKKAAQSHVETLEGGEEDLKAKVEESEEKLEEEKFCHAQVFI